MGVTWFAASPAVQDNFEYHTCQCTDHGTTETCRECEGRGAVRFNVSPESMHLGYGNAIALTRALGFITVADDDIGFDFTPNNVKYIATEGIERLTGSLRERYYIPLSRLCAVALYHKCGITWC